MYDYSKMLLMHMQLPCVKSLNFFGKDCSAALTPFENFGLAL